MTKVSYADYVPLPPILGFAIYIAERMAFISLTPGLTPSHF